MASDISTSALSEFIATHSPLLTRLHVEAGGARWDVSCQELAEALYRSASCRFAGKLPDGAALGEYLGSLHLQDLALACALRKGSTAAWEEFVADHRPLLYAAARAIVGSGGEARARELADSLYAELYGVDRSGRERSSSLLDYFHGRSRLSTWLRAILAQRHVDTLRASQRTESLDEPVAPVRPPSTAAAADQDRARLMPRLRQSVNDALAALPAADRLLLSLYYVQEMRLAQIAQVQGVHEATISRQLHRIRRETRQKVERSLLAGRSAQNGSGAQPALSPAQVELCFRYALEDWAFDLGGALSGQSGKALEEL